MPPTVSVPFGRAKWTWPRRKSRRSPRSTRWSTSVTVPSRRPLRSPDPSSATGIENERGSPLRGPDGAVTVAGPLLHEGQAVGLRPAALAAARGSEEGADHGGGEHGAPHEAGEHPCAPPGDVGARPEVRARTARGRSLSRAPARPRSRAGPPRRRAA